MINRKVFDKVNACLERYIGGEAFFNELDSMVKFDYDTMKEFIDIVNGCIIDKQNLHTIASGEFGLCLHNFGLPVNYLVQGGLRKDNPICDLSHFIKPGTHVVFLDDSYFSGKTAEVVKREVERCGGVFEGCYVIYDGSQNPIHSVESIYRYYDYFDILGNPKEWRV